MPFGLIGMPSAQNTGAGRDERKTGRDMSNMNAVMLGLVILAVFVVDAFAFGGHLPLFLGKEFAELIEYLSFWR